VTYPAAEALRGKVTQALVLSGAGNRFVIELGVVKAFWDFGLRFDLTIGSSSGALLAAWMAAAPERLDVLDGLARRAKFSDVYAFNLEVLYRLGAADGLFTNDPLLNLVDRNFPEPLMESFKTPALITATELRTGATVVFSRGPVREAIGASTAIPVVVKPRNGLVDGGLGDDLPVDLAVDAGVPVVYAVQAGYAGQLDQQPHGLLDIEQQAWTIAVARKTALDLEAAAGKTALKLFEPRLAFNVPPWQYSGLGAYIDQAYAWSMEQLRGGKHLASGSVRLRPA
jgi:NTE family protein